MAGGGFGNLLSYLSYSVATLRSHSYSHERSVVLERLRVVNKAFIELVVPEVEPRWCPGGSSRRLKSRSGEVNPLFSGADIFRLTTGLRDGLSPPAVFSPMSGMG